MLQGSGDQNYFAVRVTGSELPMSGGGFTQWVRRLNEHSQGAFFHSSNELKSSSRPDLDAGVPTGTTPERLYAIRATSLRRNNRRDPFAVRDEGDGDVDRFVGANEIDGGRDARRRERANSFEQPIAIHNRLYAQTAKPVLLGLTQGSDHEDAVGERELHGHQLGGPPLRPF